MKQKVYILLFFALLLSGITTATYGQISSQLRQRYEDTLRRLEFAKDIIATFPTPAARSIIAEAETDLQQAHEMAQNGRIRLAEQYLNTASRLIQNALRLILRNPLKTQREKLNELIEQAESTLSRFSNKRAERFLQQAKDHRSKAERAVHAIRLQQGLEQFRLATYMATKAIDIATMHDEKSINQLAVEQERLDQLFRKAQLAVQRSQNPTAGKFYRLAKKQADKIKSSKQQQSYNKVIEYYNQATRLLLRAIDIASSNSRNDELRVYDEVIALDELIESLNTNIESQGMEQNSRLQFMVDQINALQQKIHQSLDQRNLSDTRFHMQMARKLVERALQLLNRKSDIRYDQRIQDELKYLDISLDKLNDLLAARPHPEANEMKNMAIRARERALRFIERNHFPQAIATIAAAHHIIMNAQDLANGNSTEIAPLSVQNKIAKIRIQIADLSTNTPGFRKRIMNNEIIRLLDQAEKYINQGYTHAAQECVELADRYLQRLSR